MPGLRYVSLHEPSGYGQAARAYLRGLREAGVALTWTPLAWGRGGYGPVGTVDDDELGDLCGRAIAYDTVLVHTVPELMERFREHGKRLVGYTTWETDRLPRHWPALLNRLDRVLVPCAWNREVFAASGVRVPIDVVPHLPEAPPPQSPRLPQADFVFYSIGEWTERKAPWLTVRAFVEEFAADEPVTLVIKTGPRDRAKRFPWNGVERVVRRLVGNHRDRVVLITHRMSRAEVEALHGRGDCYVSLCRGEGWGLPAFEAAVAGKPVVVTGWGGQTEYLPAALSFPVDYALVPVVDRGGRPSYSPEQRWAEPSLAHARALMRRVYRRRDEAAARGARLAAYVCERFGRHATMPKLLRALELA